MGLITLTLRFRSRILVISTNLSVPLLSLSSSCRVRCSGWSPPAAPSRSWPPGRSPGGGMWLRTPPVWGTGEPPLGAHWPATGYLGNHRHCHWCASQFRCWSRMSSDGPKGGWGRRGSRPRSFDCSGRRRRRGRHRKAPPLINEGMKEHIFEERKRTVVYILRETHPS